MTPLEKGRWVVRFTDGSAISGATAATVLAKWRKVQWHETSPQAWRDELAKRAYIWSNTLVDPYLPAARFLNDLEIAGLIKIEGRA